MDLIEMSLVDKRAVQICTVFFYVFRYIVVVTVINYIVTIGDYRRYI